MRASSFASDDAVERAAARDVGGATFATDDDGIPTVAPARGESQASRSHHHVIDVPVTLLVGTLDGCQDEVAGALDRFASGSASWIRCEPPVDDAGGGACAFDAALCERALWRDALPKCARAVASRPPRVVFIARTRQPAAEVGAALRDACAAATARTAALSAPPFARFVLGAITTCVAADGFFVEAERRPSPSALAQLCPPAANNVVVLPRGGHRCGAAAAADASSAGPSIAELTRDTLEWVRAAVAVAVARTRADPVSVIVGQRALRDGALGVTEGTNLLPPPSPPPPKAAAAAAAAAGARLLLPPSPEWSTRLARATASASARDRVGARHVTAEGDVDVAKLLLALRRLFRDGRRPPPLSPSTLATMTPDQRSIYSLTRFANKDADASVVLEHVRVRAAVREEEEDDDAEGEGVNDAEGTPGGGSPGAPPRTTVKTYSFNFSSAAPFAVGAAAVEANKVAVAASSVSVFAVGKHVADQTRLDLASVLRACARDGPPLVKKKTRRDWTPADEDAVVERLEVEQRERGLPRGWYYDGAKYVSHDGESSTRHPRYDDAVEERLTELNVAVDAENVWREDARRHAKGVRVTLDRAFPA